MVKLFFENVVLKEYDAGLAKQIQDIEDSDLPQEEKCKARLESIFPGLRQNERLENG